MYIHINYYIIIIIWHIWYIIMWLYIIYVIHIYYLSIYILCIYTICFRYIYIHFFSFIFISWRLITLHYCSGFCHILTWISHEFTCIPHPNPPSHLPLYLKPLGLPSAPGPSTCLMHPTWAGDLFHPR